MNKQPRMIDKDRLLVWLEEKAQETGSWVEQVLLRNLVSEEIKKGTFDPIPLPTIKPEEVDIDGYSDKNIGFIRGVAYAAGLIKQYDTDSEQLIQESGITEEVLRKYADDYDLGNLGLLETDSLKVNP